MTADTARDVIEGLLETAIHGNLCAKRNGPFRECNCALSKAEAFLAQPSPADAYERGIRAAYLAGFEISGQGWNGDMIGDPESDPDFIEGCNRYVARALPLAGKPADPVAEAAAEQWREIEQHVQPRIADGYTAVAVSRPGFWLVKGAGPATALAGEPRT